ncbi:putative amidoligase domain-containing protein [Chengkuizengella axinellae]|uniref:Phage phiEco32-like COOH-NH2 ligase-type 2 n=1 Tax=Chengkuizengella axinellae TaxID=3064388 RepID=A0ABT9IX78_9BACL|nr:hypothetical protein [Chengkuizengella sp. 2205SS18-9]MDP5273966.1 hypothetical protein [Chengkuizengella sp. 2205SS18-9]
MNDLFLLHGNDPALKVLWYNSLLPHGTELPHNASEDTVIIQWGSDVHVPKGSKVLNPSGLTKRALDKEWTMKTLKHQGVHVQTPFSQPAYLQVYLVPVFHLNILALYQCSLHTEKVHYPHKLVNLDVRNRQHRLISRYAMRAIYALGLDFGVVKVGVISARRCTILDVNPNPEMDRVNAKLFAGAIHTYHKELIEERKRTKVPVIGTDLEFLLRNAKGKVTFASKFFGRKGQVGCDSVVNGNKWIFPIAELRPSPSKEPIQIINNIYKLMQYAEKQINDAKIEWVAGGMPVKGLPLGGHIHISGIWLNSFLLRAFDNYLTLPLMMIEDQTSLLRRPKYGFLGDFRIQVYGFEYRTPPSWIVSPAIANGVLTLARLIVDHYWILNEKPLADEMNQFHFYQGNKESLYPYVKKLWNELEKLESYSFYREHLIPLKKRIFRMKPWNEQKDIRKVWKIPPFENLSKK